MKRDDYPTFKTSRLSRETARSGADFRFWYARFTMKVAKDLKRNPEKVHLNTPGKIESLVDQARSYNAQALSFLRRDGLL